MPSSVIALVGAEFEENLSLRYLAAALEAGGWRAEIVAFNAPEQTDAVADRIAALSPLLVGLSVPFQHHAMTQLGLAAALRKRGYRGHITAGGHFATFEYAAILERFSGVDSVVRHEGEETLVELCRTVEEQRAPAAAAGLVVRGPDGIAIGPKRALPPLDALPFPDRRGAPASSFGVPVTVLSGSRGCYGDCSFCCINAWQRNALGPRYRARSPESIAAEMKQEYERRGVRLFVFHDDTFFVPSKPKNLARYRQLGELLRAAGMNDIGFVIKARPNDVDPELFAELKAMGLIRAYIGVESNSTEGLVSLNRRIRPEDNRRALSVLRELDVFHSFNLLIFDPEATLAGIAANLEFLEEYADTPFNFCRAEVYAGTPLKSILERQGRLRGDFLAWNYEMRDPRVELLFRIASIAFGPRNFKSDGIANLNMGVRFDFEVVRRFRPRAVCDDLRARAVELSRQIGLDSLSHLRSALRFVTGANLADSRTVKGYTLELAEQIASADLRFTSAIRQLRRELDARTSPDWSSPGSPLHFQTCSGAAYTALRAGAEG